MPAPRRALLPALLAASVAAMLCALGVWQLRRGTEKRAFIAALEASVVAEPKAGWDAAAPFERLRLTGRFEADKTVFVRVTLPEGLGVYVMTPLRTADRWIFVNRGFMKTAQNGKPPVIDTPGDPVSLTGLRRRPESPGMFDPPADLAARLFPARNPGIFARALVMPDVAEDYLDAEPVAGQPAPNGIDPRAVIARIPDNHLSYALTWFGLAATLVAVFGLMLRRGKNGGGQNRGGKAPLTFH